jgi:hypothetical protein
LTPLFSSQSIGCILGWIKIEGKFQHIFSGPECVIALAGNRDIYYRANVFEKDNNEVILIFPNYYSSSNSEVLNWGPIYI